MPFGEKFYQFSCRFIQILSLIFCGILGVSGLLFTCYAENMTTQEVLTRFDNPLLCIPGTLIFAITIFLCAKWFQSKGKFGKRILLFLSLGFICLCGGLFILFGRTAPAADAWSVYSAAVSLANGDTSVIHPTASYLSYYPQQVGLVAFFEGIVRIWNLFSIDLEAYHFIKCFYVFFTCSIVFFQYKTVHLLWENDFADCIYLLLATINFPLIMYASFVYGETPSFAALSVGIYFFLKLMKQKSQTRLSAVISLFSFALAVMLRKNTLVFMIALVAVSALEALSQKRKTLYLYTLLCILLSLSILPLIQKSYEHRAHNTLKSGVTAMAYFAMGMQESSRGNGWYNGFNFNTYQESGMDAQLTNQISREYIGERIDYFKANPSYALSFYANKYLSQWADGTFASRQATLATLGERHPQFKELYDGAYSPFYIEFCNLYQNLLYLGSFFYFLNKKKEGHKLTLYPYLCFIAVFGGFLFHMIWEANARYIFLYSLLLLPYSACGLSLFSNTCALGRFRKNSTNRKASEVQAPPTEA